ncbi:hypothetical protein [Devosia sp. SL43]|uniref:hypothetical protein n=1 Tax=Devosia sp. SL43 TaxID=2806348 RepID=UPI001F3C1685|nr:hypothetical protein [Devosia sp. SL43]UJW84607.1 hypothetical protein IM737_14400 [Devosia sp. SL43]
MKTLLTALALSLAFGSTAFAFDAETQDVIGRHKANKPLNSTDIATLMRSSERWCYAEDAGTCSWSDIYLDVTDEGAEFEIGNAWSETVDVMFTDTGVFKDSRYICEAGIDWVPTLRAANRSDNTIVTGKELKQIKTDLYATQSETVIDCFDYLYRGSDAETQTITLLQRQYTEDVYDPSKDTEVTLHFNADNAAALTWRW